MLSDRTIPNNKPDIIIRDNEKRTCILIDVAIPGDRNVIKKEAEKILKRKDLTIEKQRMWKVKTRVIPVIIGATGTISGALSYPEPLGPPSLLRDDLFPQRPTNIYRC